MESVILGASFSSQKVITEVYFSEHLYTYIYFKIKNINFILPSFPIT